MPTDPAERLRAAVTASEKADAEKLAAILAALNPDSGVRQADVVRITGYSREHLRKLAREHGIQSRRAATS